MDIICIVKNSTEYKMLLTLLQTISLFLSKSYTGLTILPCCRRLQTEEEIWVYSCIAFTVYCRITTDLGINIHGRKTQICV